MLKVGQWQTLMILIGTTISLSGCVFSNQVAAIGVYERYGDVPESAANEAPHTLMLYERKLGAGGEDGFGIPYRGYAPRGEAIPLGNYDYTPAYDKQGQLSGVKTSKGRLRVVMGTGNEPPPTGTVRVEKRSRSAAGYAAQSLQVLAVPVDSVLMVGYGIIYLAATAFEDF